MPVIIGDAFRDPQTTRIRRAREIPGTKFNRPQPLHVPDMKKFVRDRVECLFVDGGIDKFARHDNLRGSQVFHTVT